MAAKKPAVYCSFCRKSHSEVARLVAGSGVYICSACIERAAEAVAHPGPDDFLGWQEFATGDLLKMLKPSVATLDAVRDDLQAKIDELRRRDVSWAAIGETLGVSRQAAWERFS
jgi:hypothetical protein